MSEKKAKQPPMSISSSSSSSSSSSEKEKPTSQGEGQLALRARLIDCKKHLGIEWTVGHKGIIKGRMYPLKDQSAKLCILTGPLQMPNGWSKREGKSKFGSWCIVSVQCSIQRTPDEYVSVANPELIRFGGEFEQWWRDDLKANWQSVVVPKLAAKPGKGQHKWFKVPPSKVLSDEGMIIPDCKYPMYTKKKKEEKKAKNGEGGGGGGKNKNGGEGKEEKSEGEDGANAMGDDDEELANRAMAEAAARGGEGGGGDGGGGAEGEKKGEGEEEGKEDEDAEDGFWYNLNLQLPKPDKMLSGVTFEKSPGMSVAEWRTYVGEWTGPKGAKKRPEGKGLECDDVLVYIEGVTLNPTTEGENVATLNAIAQRFTNIRKTGKSLVNQNNIRVDEDINEVSSSSSARVKAGPK